MIIKKTSKIMITNLKQMISICKLNPDKIIKLKKKIQRRKPKNNMTMTLQIVSTINQIQTIPMSNNPIIMQTIHVLRHKTNNNL